MSLLSWDATAQKSFDLALIMTNHYLEGKWEEQFHLILAIKRVPVAFSAPSTSSFYQNTNQ